MVTPVPNEEALTDDELEQLEVFLSSRGPSAMNIEQFDGFLTALIAGPDPVMPSEYWPVVLGEAEFNFERMEDAQAIFDLVTRHWNTIAATLNASEIYEPILLQDDDGIAKGNDWAKGFMRGIEMREESWRLLIDDDNVAGLVVPMMMLSHEHDPDPDLRPAVITAEKRDQAIIFMVAALPRIFKLFQAKRTPMTSTYKRSEAKVGRNEPCPCNSGKKYKNCCGMTH